MSYNGHKNWNHWNVSLWISNDEGLYETALESVELTDTKGEATLDFLDRLDGLGITHTRDGAEFTYTSVRAAMDDI